MGISVEEPRLLSLMRRDQNFPKKFVSVAPLAQPRLYVYWDGSCTPNPGEMGLGAVVLDQHGQLLARRYRNAGFGDNNLAEYKAALMAISLVQEICRRKRTRFYWELKGDSLLVVKNVKGTWACQGELRRLAMELRKSLGSHQITWISRKDNRLADHAASEAFDLRYGEIRSEYSGLESWWPRVQALRKKAA